MVRGEKRESLVKAAMGLFHRKGYGPTSLADIATEAGVPLGNVYYYFKTREELLKAVVQGWLEQARPGRTALEALPDPRQRVLGFLDGLGTRAEERAAFGCPAGGLCQEINKQGGPTAEEVSILLGDALDWLGRQFKAMGFREAQARDFAARLMGGYQGSILLANTFKEPQYVRAEIARLKGWVAELPLKERKKP